jgi:actin cytoskeleton-regulatory complex protein SLA1
VSTLHMSTSGADVYLAVLKASYDYEPQSEDEIAVKEDQILFLLERTDEEYVDWTHCAPATHS